MPKKRTRVGIDLARYSLFLLKREDHLDCKYDSAYFDILATFHNIAMGEDIPEELQGVMYELNEDENTKIPKERIPLEPIDTEDEMPSEVWLNNFFKKFKNELKGGK